MTVILAESELALKEGVDPAETVDALSIIRSRAVRLNRRIDDLLRVARSETGQVELDSRPFDCAMAAEEAVAGNVELVNRVEIAQLPLLSTFLIRWHQLKYLAMTRGVQWPLA